MDTFQQEILFWKFLANILRPDGVEDQQKQNQPLIWMQRKKERKKKKSLLNLPHIFDFDQS